MTYTRGWALAGLVFALIVLGANGWLVAAAAAWASDDMHVGPGSSNFPPQAPYTRTEKVQPVVSPPPPSMGGGARQPSLGLPRGSTGRSPKAEKGGGWAAYAITIPPLPPTGTPSLPFGRLAHQGGGKGFIRLDQGRGHL